MSLPFLQSIGLTSTETSLYEALLKLGDVPIADILVETKLKRTTAYKALYSLQKKGLLSINHKNKKIHFQPAPPAKLLEIANSQFNSLERAKSDIQAILPSMTSSYVASVEKPVVTIYEGEEGIKKANLAVLAERQDILAYLIINEQIDERLESFWKKYYAIRKSYQIYVRSITPNTKAGMAYKRKDSDQLRETLLIPSEKFPFTIEKNIVGNKVVFFSTQGDKLIATIVENKAIADTERAIFELAWIQAKHYDEFLSK